MKKYLAVYSCEFFLGHQPDIPPRLRFANIGIIGSRELVFPDDENILLEAYMREIEDWHANKEEQEDSLEVDDISYTLQFVSAELVNRDSDFDFVLEE